MSSLVEDGATSNYCVCVCVCVCVCECAHVYAWCVRVCATFVSCVVDEVLQFEETIAHNKMYPHSYYYSTNVTRISESRFSKLKNGFPSGGFVFEFNTAALRP